MKKQANGLFCKEVKKYYIPHHQDYDTFKDWGLKKEYDMILFGNHSFRKLYPFRWKLFKMLKREMRNNDKYNLKYIRHPDIVMNQQNLQSEVQNFQKK